MPNPFDDPAPGAKIKGNPFDDHAHAGAHNPFNDAVGGAASAVGGIMQRLGVPKVIDILDRQRQTTQAGIARGPGAALDTLIHGADSYQQDSDRASLRKKLGAPGDADRKQGRGLRGGVDDFAIDTLSDPVTYETLGLGAIAKGVGKLGKAAIDASGVAKSPIAERAAEYAHAVTDKFTAGGSAKRDLGEPRYNRAMNAENRQAAKEAEAKRLLTQRFDAAIAPLQDEEKRTVYRALNGEAQLHDPASGRPIVAPHVLSAFEQLDKLRNDAGALYANESGRRRLAYGKGNLANARLAAQVEPWDLSYAKRQPTSTAAKIAAMNHSDDVAKFAGGKRRVVARTDKAYELPPELREFAAPDDQGVLGALNLRQHYLPAPHNAEEVAKDAPAREFNILRPMAPNATQRDEFQVGDKGESLTGIDEAFRGMLASAARQGTSGRLRDEIGVPLSFNGKTDSAMEKLFDRTSKARGANRSTGQKFGEDWQRLVNIPKNTVTTLGLKHGIINVPALAAMSEGPGAALESLVKGAQLSLKSEGARYDALRQGIEGGVITPFEERENPIADTLARLPGPLGKTIGAASKGANTLTWAIDDAAKAAMFRRKLARGMEPDAAAAETMREMVDYRHRSQATEMLSKVAPFATFRSKLPAAIASSGSRHPERLLAADRATDGLSSNGKVDVDGHHIGVTTPISDALELVDEPQKYARATLADPVKALLSPLSVPTKFRDKLTGEENVKDQKHFFTYGQPLLPHQKDGQWKAGFLGSQAAGYAPLSIGQAILGAAGAGEFPTQDLLSQLLGGTLGIHVR